jgi:glycosyltransferase involved in cell wall biosynthesis
VTAALRIAVIASSRYPIRQPFAGGLEAHVWHLSHALALQGHEVSLFAADGSDPALGCDTLTVRELTLSHAASGDISMPAPTFMAEHHAYLSLMLDLARTGADRFDLVHNHSLHHLPVAMAPMLNIPMVTTLHTPPTPWLESALNTTAGEGTRLAAVSRHTAAAWRHLSDDIVVVPNGVDTDRWPLGPGGDYLVWFGRITPEKGTHLAIAAARCAGLPLVIAGPVSDPAYFDELVRPHLDDDPDVRYAGHLAQDALADLVGHACAALATPTWDEPYGLVIAESMSCGTPVVAFARGGITELVSEHSGRLVPTDDVAAMAAAIPVAARLPRHRVRRHAIRRCSADAMLRTYLTLYRNMIDESRNVGDDRLLRAPSRLRTPRQSDEHLRPDATTGHGIEQQADPRAPSVHRRGRASA